MPPAPAVMVCVKRYVERISITAQLIVMFAAMGNVNRVKVLNCVRLTVVVSVEIKNVLPMENALRTRKIVRWTVQVFHVGTGYVKKVKIHFCVPKIARNLSAGITSVNRGKT
jgi:hypothetical protein